MTAHVAMDAALEEAVLGRLLINPQRYDDVRLKLHADTFASPRLQNVMRAFVEQWAEGAVDVVSVAKRADCDPESIFRLMGDQACSPSLLERHVDELVQLSQSRQVIHALSVAQGRLHDAESIPDVLAELQEQAASVLSLEGELPEGAMLFNQWTEQAERVGVQPWVIPGVIRQMGRLMIVAREGHGKALRLDEPILTPAGWRTMGDLEPGDVVYASDGSETFVLATTEDHVPRSAYRLTFNTGETIDCSGQHEWIVRDYHGRQPGKKYRTRVVTTEQMAAEPLARGGHTVNWSIDHPGALLGEERDLPIDPYLLGVWLGDGTSASANITLNLDDIDAIVSHINALGYPTKRPEWGRRGHGQTMRVGGGFQRQLRELGVLGNKHIPTVYLQASTDQRKALLAGLLDTDGCIQEARGEGRGQGCASVEFVQNIGPLCDGFEELLRGLGLVPGRSTHDSKLDGRVVGRHDRFRFVSTWNPFRYSERRLERWFPPRTQRSQRRYVQSIEPIEPTMMKCIQVDSADSSYLAGRGLIPTHNSTFCRQIAVASAIGMHPFNGKEIPRQRVLLVDLENDPATGISDDQTIDPAGAIGLYYTAKSRRPDMDWSNFMVWSRPDGIDLRSHWDTQALERIMDRFRPDLVVFGPIYKAYTKKAGEDDEALSAGLQKALDRLRLRYRAAWVFEHHAPHGGIHDRAIRPFGSSLWLRWPDIGIAMHTVFDADEEDTGERKLKRFRGDRYRVTAIPRSVRRGTLWPWVDSAWSWEQEKERMK